MISSYDAVTQPLLFLKNLQLHELHVDYIYTLTLGKLHTAPFGKFRVMIWLVSGPND